MSETEAPALETLADGTHRVRVRYGKARNRFRIPSTDPDFAQARAVVLIEMGAMLGNVPPELARGLLQRAGAADGPELERIKAGVRRLASGGVDVRRKEVSPRALWTMRELGEAWTKGDLAKEFPDQVKVRRSSGDDVSRLRDHVYPKIGDVRVRDVTLADLERVMSSLEGQRRKQLSAGTRRHVALALNRLLSLAVYPLKIRETNPLPKGFLPRKASRKALAYIYPSEDAALLACGAVPMARRLLWGFLIREGCRVSEALALRWSDLDLQHGAVRLDENKTDDPRAWALSPGVAAALAQFRGEPEALVFEPPAEPERLATRLRRDLKLAGINRPELFERTTARLAMRVHDLRASFVTIALAAGKSEAWVTDRTGHRSHEMVHRYRRAKRQAAELRLGDWVPLDVALSFTERAAQSHPVAKVTTLPNNDNAKPAAGRDSKRDSVARPTGFEPVTYGSGGRNRSGQGVITCHQKSRSDGVFECYRSPSHDVERRRRTRGGTRWSTRSGGTADQRPAT
jgi:integrase